MQMINVHEDGARADEAALAERVLERAYLADRSLIVAECFTGGAIAAELAACERYTQQFAGAYMFNNVEAMHEILGVSPVSGAVTSQNAASLALDIARSALRASRAGFALAVVGPRSGQRAGLMCFAVVDQCDHAWHEEFYSDTRAGGGEWIGRALAFLARCIARSDTSHF